MLNQDTARIPLRARDGSVRAYAIVDAADADWVNQWRWRIVSKGYVGRNRKVIYLHRALMGLVHGDGLEVDHIDRDRLNYRRQNLRVVTHAGNTQNKPSHRGTSSVYRGVSWHKATRKWHATVGSGGKMANLGFFECEADAGEAARLAREKLLPFAVD